MYGALGDLGHLFPGYQLRTAIEPDESGAYALIRLGDVSPKGLAGGLLRMDLDLDEARYRVQAGDVLCRSRGGNYSAGVVGELDRATIALSPLYVFRAGLPGVLPGFVAWWLNAPDAQKALESAAVGSNIKTVPISAYAHLEIPLPPLSVQSRVVEIDRLNVEERELEHRLAEARADYIERLLIDMVNKSAMEERQ